MSHIVEIKTEVRDPAAIQAACRRLGLPQPVHQSTKLFSAEATGLAVQLPDWRYPIVCDTNSGTLHYDNFNGAWGDQAKLDQFLQTYAIEKARLEARKQGYAVTETAMADGAVKLTINVGGAA